MSGYVAGEIGRPRNVNPPWTLLPDDGCNVSATCLACGLPACKYDDLAGYRAWKREQKKVAR